MTRFVRTSPVGLAAVYETRAVLRETITEPSGGGPCAWTRCLGIEWWVQSVVQVLTRLLEGADAFSREQGTECHRARKNAK